MRGLSHELVVKFGKIAMHVLKLSGIFLLNDRHENLHAFLIMRSLNHLLTLVSVLS